MFKPSSTMTEEDSGHLRLTWPEPHRKARSRVTWEDEDEISLLNAVLEITTSTSQSSESISLFQRIESSLRHVYSRNRMVDKLQELKRRYYRNRDSEAQIGSTHDQNLFEISEKIWGGKEKSKEEETDAEIGNTEEEEEREKMVGVLSGFVDVGLGLRGLEVRGVNSDLEGIMRKGLERIEGTKLKKLKEEWREQEKRELEIFCKRMELIQELTHLITNALTSKNKL